MNAIERTYAVLAHQIPDRVPVELHNFMVTARVLAQGTPELVAAKCREAIEVLGKDGGFILGAGCALPATTPDENLHALVETAKMFPYLQSAR